MAATPSQMLALGTALPPFTLPDVVTGQPLSSSALAGKPAVVAFICNHCPYVKHLQAVWSLLDATTAAQGVGMVAVSSNDPDAYPAGRPRSHGRRSARARIRVPVPFR